MCLVDFGCSIDTHVFPEETMFVGSSETDAFQCPAMIEGRPWKWQVRQNRTAVPSGVDKIETLAVFYLSTELILV